MSGAGDRERTVLVLGGPTATGKTALAIALAQESDAEIVGADSRQIYRGMPIGTAAPTPAEQAAVTHHLIGFLDPHERYSAARFANDATVAVRDIHRRGKHAIVVGGSGFYIRALTGSVNLAPQLDERLRVRLAHEARTHPTSFLHQWLTYRDPRRAAAIAPNDAYRVLRALEIALAPDESRARATPLNTLASAGIRFAKLFLDAPLEVVDARIERRISAMLADGLVQEAERIGVDAVAANAVGYPQALGYVRGWSTQAELATTLARATRRYSRRQRAWFRTEPDMRRVDWGEAAHAAREILGIS